MISEHAYLIAPNGRIFDLRDLNLRVTGIGDIPVEYHTSQGYQQHGVTVRDWRLSPRTISFAFDLSERTRSRLWEARTVLIDTLRPNNRTGIVTYRRVLPSGARRDIQGRVAELSYVEIDGRNVETGFALFCPDPSFFDPRQQTGTLTASEDSAFALPFAMVDDDDENDLWFGSSTHISATVTNPGSWRGYPVLTITGPYTRLVVHNDTTGATFTLGGAGAADGDAIVVTLTPGATTITHNGVSALDELEAGNLVDWYLESGANVIQASGVGLTANTAIQVAYYPRYMAL